LAAWLTQKKAMAGLCIIRANFGITHEENQYLRGHRDRATMVQGIRLKARIMQVFVYFKELSKWVIL
jgi:hypothetical protein